MDPDDEQRDERNRIRLTQFSHGAG